MSSNLFILQCVYRLPHIDIVLGPILTSIGPNTFFSLYVSMADYMKLPLANVGMRGLVKTRNERDEHGRTTKNTHVCVLCVAHARFATILRKLVSPIAARSCPKNGANISTIIYIYIYLQGRQLQDEHSVKV
jgi:hypothetical protein